MQENQTKLSVGHGGAALKHVTFEAGAKKMSEKLKNGTAESFFANAADPLHAAFEAKAVIHSLLKPRRSFTPVRAECH